VAGFKFFGTLATLTLTIGTDTSQLAAPTTTTPTSGVGFTPSTTTDSTVLIPVNATTVGTVAITVGGVTFVPTSNLVALSEPTFTVPVRRNQVVVVTITGTTVAIGLCTIVPH